MAPTMTPVEDARMAPHPARRQHS